MTSLTTTQILTLARAKMLEATSDILSDVTLLIYANLTYDDIVKRTFTSDQIKTATVSFTNGIGTLPTDFGTMYADGYDTDGRAFPELSIQDFAIRSLPNSVTIEGGVLKVYPTTTPTLTIRYYPSYAALTTSVNPTFNPYFNEAIIYGILARAYEDLQDEQLADRYQAKYEDMLEKKIGKQSNYEEDNQRGGQMFVEQQLVGNSGVVFSSSPNYF